MRALLRDLDQVRKLEPDTLIGPDKAHSKLVAIHLRKPVDHEAYRSGLDEAAVTALAPAEVELEFSYGGQPSYWWLISAE